ncbi:hypothetical protein CJD36_014710 [Flavipsychrobacter stenotrophus]|uniref:BIG2 domain-containing protein n=1 Tax=Flavipsychrobacter stenotrophus TaxID=2077091 RepID=A0A2S7SSP5_9BACT|nr:Ig-like domain-containing protein [Flavipsychrobacter stenotrophus]PQJ09949.1 hypothetical protein CJD36_014710 [Flavipsychrobacter stenotrophus]
MKMKFTSVYRNVSFAVFLSIFVIVLFMGGTKSIGQPTFNNGATQSFSVCENSGALDITSYLTINDLTSGSTETWTVVSSTSGTLGGFDYAGFSNGADMTPVGLFYTPPAGFSGTDVFKIRVSDGTITDETTITVTVAPSPVLPAIGGLSSVCAGSTIVLTSDSTGGAWSSSDNAVATIDAGTGTVTGVAAGSATLSYIFSNSCGIDTATLAVTVQESPAPITGINSIVAGQTITLNESVAGGMWSSSDAAIATVTATGVVTGLSFGNANISYSTGCGITAAFALSVLDTMALSDANDTTVCAGADATLSALISSGGSGGGGSGFYTDLHWEVSTDGGATFTTVADGGDYTYSGESLIVHTTTSLTGNSYRLYVDGGVSGNGLLTVNPIPDAGTISGANTVCTGAAITLAETVTGGVWTASNSSATVVGGVVTGVTEGVDTIIYTVTSLGCTATATYEVTINALPDAGSITGQDSVCIGASVMLSSTVIGGTWTTSDALIATVDAGGNITGLGAGSVTIVYTSTTPSCGTDTANHTVTVNPLPDAGAISGAANVCVGSVITLTNTVSGGDWTSSSLNATVDAAGVVTGVTAGSVTITYTANTFSCGANFSTHNVTIDALPDAGDLSGLDSVCVNASILLTSTVGGGAWTTTDASVATVDAGGNVTGVAASSVTIVYTSTTASCGTDTVNHTITVNPLPDAGTISGATGVCVGGTITLTNTVSGSDWTSSSPNATVDAFGVVTGVTAGSSTITYTANTFSCGSAFTTHNVTIDALPDAGALSGLDSVCVNASILLTSTVGGGAWTTTDASLATVDAGGNVTGVAAGSVTIVYTSTTATCGTDTVNHTITVSPLPDAGTITGATGVCVGSTINLVTTGSGGDWTSSSTDATVDAAGVVTGVSTGSAIISYAVTNSCGTAVDTQLVSVNVAPTGIVISTSATTLCGSTPGDVTFSGPAGAVVRYQEMLSDEVGATRIDTLTTTLDGAGNATVAITTTRPGLTGNITFLYTLLDATSGACSASYTAADNVTFATHYINGWLTNVSGSGVYTVPTDGAQHTFMCRGNTAVVHLATEPFATAIFKIHNAATGTDTYDTLVADVIGHCDEPTLPIFDTLIYTVVGISNGGCSAFEMTYGIDNFSLLPLPQAQITSRLIQNTLGTGVPIDAATSQVCDGTDKNIDLRFNVEELNVVEGTPTTPMLTYHINGGSDITVPMEFYPFTTTINTGTISGNTTIYFTQVADNAGCPTTLTDSINLFSIPAPVVTISGAAALCAGSTTTISADSSGGVWSSSNIAVAIIDATTGVVSAIAAGISVISYNYTGLCGSGSDTMLITVNALPDAGAITGLDSVCANATIALSTTGTGGVWSTTDAAVATVDGSGTVTGVGAGDATISYTATSASCGTMAATHLVTVNSLPDAGTLSGADTICSGTSTMIVSTVPGGAWTITGLSATIDASGNVTGNSAGDNIVVYISSTFSCGQDTSWHPIYVKAAPDAGTITGPSSMCVGSTATLSSDMPGGVYSSFNTSVVSSDAAGNLTALSADTVTILYTVNSPSCGSASAGHFITVTPLPDAGSITGSDSVCVNGSVLLATTTTGGTWSTSDATVATVDGAGNVTGLIAGSAMIVYTSTASCGTDTASHLIIVNPLPDAGAITGADSICFGDVTTLTNTTSGGTWSSADANVAVDATTGEVTAILSGTATITYTAATFSCGSATTTHTLVVKSLPDAGTISGLDSVCAGAVVTLSNTASGGVWTSDDNAIATVDITGAVSGVAAGTTTITYTSYVFGCTNARTVFGITVNAASDAGAISGADSICFGDATTLTNTVSGGTWSSTDVNVAVDAATGEVTGMISGTATITYTATTFSCGSATATHTLVVKTLPDAGTISGLDSICAGAVVTLSNTASGGVWSSNDNAIATVDATGNVSGVAAGTTTISYTSSIFGCTSATSTHDVTVNALPDAGTISGADSICFGDATTLTNTASGGTWSSADANVAVDAATGEVTGMLSGTATITYTANTFSCGSATATHTLVVKSLPDAGTISGLDSVCAGAVVTLSNTASGGVWSSNDNAIATVDATGNVSGVSAGTTTISYTSSIFGCSSATSTYDVTVNPLPDAGTISGAANVCFGLTTTLTNTASTGTWSSSDNAIATVDASGIVTSVATGTATISYTANTFSCGSLSATHTIIVDSLPDPGTITGFDTVAIGTDITLTATVGGGIWTSSDPAATVVGGVVTGVSVGNATISYTVTNSCGTTFATKDIVIDGCPLPDTGIISSVASSTCAGSTITLTTTVAGGNWITSDASVATVDVATGIVSGVAAGNVIVSYTTTNTCGSSIDTIMLAIDALPDAGTISGLDSVCAAASITLTNTVTGGTWSSADANVTVDAVTGAVTGVTAGTATITYTAATFSCASATATHTVTVNALPDAGAISGLDSVCAAASITLTNTVTGGTWSSADANVTVDAATGAITGVSAGTATITYTATTFSCGSATATHTVTVNALPDAGTISGLDSVCAAASITLTNTVTGGTWSSADANVTVDAVTGAITGISAGTATITYTAATFSCGNATATHSVTVNALPDAGTISGLDSVCAAASITLTNTVTGGTWSSADANVTVDAVTGAVTGVSAGTTTITYTAATFSCGSATATHSVTVNALPDAGTISGLDSVCAAASITLTNTVTGGTWSSADANVTVDALTGAVTGVSSGTATISYTAATFSCGSATATHAVTVNALPDAGTISGLDSVCAAASITLTNTVTGGTWSSADANVTVDAVTGAVTGVSAGTATITYTASTFSCGSATANHTVTVNALPDAGTISGLDSVCAAASITLTNTVTGGTWSSADANVTVDAVTGAVTGVSAGTATITYTATTFSCGSATATHSVTVNVLPDAGTISGLDSVCAAASITLTNTVTGGAWSSADANVTVDAVTGAVTGVSAGTATITYTATTFSCGSATATHSVTVNALPDAGTITGTDSVCVASAITLTNTVTGGAWSSSDNSVATIDAAGVVSGVAAGTVTITYTATTFSCGSATATHTVTVNALPGVPAITGITAVCEGVSTTLSNTTTGGVWSSTNTTVASVNASGVVTAGVAGSATILYTVTSISGCTTIQGTTFTVNPLPVLSPITGAIAVASLSSITLTDTAAGGIWTSSDPTRAVINATTGVVTGVAIGTTTITYTKTSGFGCTSFVTYNLIVAGSLTSTTILPFGSATLCHGNDVNLVTVTAGGVTDQTFQWYIDGIAIPGATNQSYITDTFGFFNVVITNLAGSHTVTGVTVVLPPTPVIHLTGANILYTGSFATYQWYLNGVAITGANTSIYNETAPGAYTVVVSDGNGCTDTADAYYIWPAGVQNAGGSGISVKLFPNPATSVIYIQSSVKVNIAVLTADGKKVIESNDATSIDINNLANGMYMIMVYDQDNMLLKVDRIMKVD